MDIDHTLQSIVALHSVIPEDGFTASTLGTERVGSGIVIREDGVVLTIGYLITEAETVWLTSQNGRIVQGHPLAYDQESGFGLVQAFGDLGLPALDLGEASNAKLGDSVILAGAGPQKFVRSHIIGKQEFAGYWEYLLDEAIFTAPAHPLWGGAGLIDENGKLLGVGSLLLQQMAGNGKMQDINMVVPIDLLKPILDDMLTYGQVNKPARPWLGIYSAESEDRIVVASLADNGPAAQAGLQEGDVIASVRDEAVEDLADFYRKVWSSGPAGTEIPLEVIREGRSFWVRVKSADRGSYLKKPSLQ